MYKWDVEDYNKSSSEQQKWARELIEKLRLRGDEHVLDIGSGDGKVTAELARRVPKGVVLGIDSSEGMVRFAREKFQGAEYNNLRFEMMDARALTFKGGFDVVFSNATLHWVTDHRPVLAGIKNSLNPAGRILLQMGGKGNASEVVEAIEAVLARDSWKGYFQNFAFPYGFFGPDEYRGWLLMAGFIPRRAELIEKDMIHKGKEGLSAWLRTTWLPYTQRVPEERRSKFIDEVAEEYMRMHHPDSQGLVHVKMVRLEVEAANP
jgi:trans-aconitate methyltransferase